MKIYGFQNWILLVAKTVMRFCSSSSVKSFHLNMPKTYPKTHYYDSKQFPESIKALEFLYFLDAAKTSSLYGWFVDRGVDFLIKTTNFFAHFLPLSEGLQ